MTLNQLVVFRAVTRHLNLTRAAEELDVAEPTISKQLKILQDEYGAKLYCRLDSGGISLTEEGQAFVRHVNVFLAETPFP